MTNATTANTVAGLSYEQTVPRSLAHRTNLGEVLITDSAATGPDEFAVAFQVPRAHLLWADRHAGHHDVFAAAEAARQASFVVIHRHLGIPVGLPFTMHGFEFRLTDPEALRDDHRTALQGQFRYRVVRHAMRGREQGDLSFEGTALVGGRRALWFAGDVVFLPGEDYRALRAYQRRRRPAQAPVPPARPVSPAAVGRRDDRNVLLGEPEPDASGAMRFPLLADRDHPSFFDHDYDHLPGPLCVEAFRQAAVLTAHRAGRLCAPRALVVSARASFTDFAEIDAPATCSAELRPDSVDAELAVEVGLQQFGKTIATGTLTLTPQ